MDRKTLTSTKMRRKWWVRLSVFVLCFVLVSPLSAYAEWDNDKPKDSDYEYDDFQYDPGRTFKSDSFGLVEFTTLGDHGITWTCLPYGDNEAVVYEVLAANGGKIEVPETIYDAVSEKTRTIVGIIAGAELSKGDFPYEYSADPFRFHANYGNVLITDLVLPKTMRFIGRGAFYGYKDLKTVTFQSDANHPLTIERQAFSYCSALESVSFKTSNPVTVEARAFYNCKKLETMTFPVGSSVSDYALHGCCNIKEVINAPSGLYMGYGEQKLESVVFDPTLTIIRGLTAVEEREVGEGLHQDFTVGFPHLTTVTMPDNCLEIWSEAFYECSNLTTINNLDWSKITYIGSEAFYGCSNLKTISKLDCSNMESIGYQAFRGCNQIKLENVKFTGSAQFMDDYFYDCGLVSVTLPGDITLEDMEMHGTAFRKCYDLTSINVESAHEPGDGEFFSVDGVLYVNLYGQIILVKYPANKNAGGSFTVPSNVHSISGTAFEGCKLAELHIPTSVKEVLIFDPDPEEGFEGLDPFENASASLVIYVATDIANEHMYFDLIEHYDNVKREPGYEIDDSSDEPTPVNPQPAPVVNPTAPAAPAEIVDLPTVKISKPKAARKKITVKWKKVSKKNLKKISGIQIQVATDPGFTNIVKTATAGKKKTSKTIKGLSSRTKYYVRIRAYAAGSHVSAWKSKSIKLK